MTTITNSQSKAFLDCTKAYDYKFGQLLTPRRMGLPLKRGAWLHELLEAHYNGYGWKKRNKELAKEFNKMFEEEREYYGDLPTICANIMKAYCYWWKDEDADWEIVEVERKFEVELPSGHTFLFKIDALIEDDYGIWLLEHKSHKNIPGDNQRFIDIQSTRYVWGLRQLGYDVQGVIWNYLRTKEPTKPPQLKRGGISMAKKYDTELFTFVQALKEYGLNPRDFRDRILSLKNHSTYFRRERVPRPEHMMVQMVKEIDEVASQIERGYDIIRNIRTSCVRNCDYLELCMTELYGGDKEQVERLNFRKADTRDYYGLEAVKGGLEIGE